MLGNPLAEIKKAIELYHNYDKTQLEVVFSDEDQIMVEAPAGYGKTMTMISRIVYLYVSGEIPNPKKMLALTFSVNAALKIKRDVSQKIPQLLKRCSEQQAISDRITITNYHGLCKKNIKKVWIYINGITLY